MTHPLSSDIFKSDAEALVNPVNTVGVMGAGLARAFREKYPKNYKLYVKACSDRTVSIGNGVAIQDGGKWIINFPTKDHWQDQSKIKYIELGLINLIDICNLIQVKSVAVPKLGCGLGGLDWKIVRPMIVSAFTATKIDLQLYE